MFDIWVENKAFVTRLESLEKAVTAFFHLFFLDRGAFRVTGA